MSTGSVEFACETELMGLLAPTMGFIYPNIKFRHHEIGDGDPDDPANQAILDCVVFKGVMNENELDGLMCRNGTVTLTYASATASAEQSDAIAAAMVKAIYTPAMWPDDLVFPGYMSIEPDSTTERDDGNKQRTRIVTVPVKALYIQPRTADTTIVTSDTTEETADAA